MKVNIYSENKETPLFHDKSLKEQGIKSGDLLYYKRAIGVGSMLIYIQSRGRIINFWVEPSDTIKQLKSLIKENVHFPDGSRVQYQGKYLEDEKTISDYGIKKESKIYLKYLLNGTMVCILLHVSNSTNYSKTLHP